MVELNLNADAEQISPTIKKYGPCGNMAGRERQIDHMVGSIDRIVKICVRHGSIVDRIIVYFQRFDGTEKEYSFGGVGGTSEEISFEEDEYITCVRGCFGPYESDEIRYVSSIEITTNYNVYGPYGEEDGQYPQYEFKPVGGRIIGFHGRFGRFVDAIGVYVKLNMERRENEETVEELETTGMAIIKLGEKDEGQELGEKDEDQELVNSYSKVLDENKALKRLVIMAKEYEKFRIWIEDQAAKSYGMVRFTKFTREELEVATNDKMNMVLLGTGGFGSVYQALIGETTVAIKILNEDGGQGEKEFNQEVEILKKIRHPNLVTLIGACPDLHALVYEFLPNGSLEDRLKDKKILTWRERIKIAECICSALVFLHNTKPKPIARSDLKSSNILFDLNDVCKLGDFGISRLLEYTADTSTPSHITEFPKGTATYIDPEFEETKKLTPHSDVYAFGIIMLQLVTGKGPNNIREFVVDKLGTTLNDINLEKFKKRTPLQQQKLLEKLLEDTKLVEWPIEVALKMTSLGLWCSSYKRKDRPDLVTEVWSEIESMNEFAMLPELLCVKLCLEISCYCFVVYHMHLFL